ncbi:MAG: HAMP domain-containing sensor histidine kinase [Cyanobacteriota bacterium]|nr:HAMP domain-containing sensor histidine kinase [Cyanobacteriota bacterium]
MRWALLTALMVLVFQLEHLFGLHAPDVGVFAFSLVPLLLGILWLTPGQELLLGAINVLLLFGESLRDAESLEGSILRLLSRVVIIGLCFWITRLRVVQERQQQELEIRAENAAAVAKTCLKASALSHEIRQPLSVILLSSQLLQKKLAQMEAPDPDLAAHLQEMVTCANQVNRTIAAMGFLIRSTKTHHERLDLAAVVQSALLSLRPALDDGGVELRCSGLENPLPLLGDGEQLRIACSNLLDNALEAVRGMPPGQRCIQVSLERRSGQAWLTVADSGAGLPQESLEVSLLTSSKPEGMGLGLFITQTIARHHGGELRCNRSSALGGAEFRLMLSGCC